jgi:hypothetical protein
MDVLTHLWQYFTSLPAETWIKFFEGVTASGLVALALQWLKNKFKIDGKRVILTILSAMSAIVSAAGWVVVYGATANLSVAVPELAKIWGFIMLVAMFIHRFALSPTYKRIQKTLQEWAEFKESKTPDPNATVGPVRDAPKLAE